MEQIEPIIYYFEDKPASFRIKEVVKLYETIAKTQSWMEYSRAVALNMSAELIYKGTNIVIIEDSIEDSASRARLADIIAVNNLGYVTHESQEPIVQYVPLLMQRSTVDFWTESSRLQELLNVFDANDRIGYEIYDYKENKYYISAGYTAGENLDFVLSEDGESSCGTTFDRDRFKSYNAGQLGEILSNIRNPGWSLRSICAVSIFNKNFENQVDLWHLLQEVNLAKSC